jgi:hypothetical protein
MRRCINLSFALTLALIVALNATPLLAKQGTQPCEPVVVVNDQQFQQDCDSNFAEGLNVIGLPNDGSSYRFYDVVFNGESGNEVGAYIPERFNPDAMVVKVLAGVFAFRVQGPGVVVDPQGQNTALEKFIADPLIGPGENPNAQAADQGKQRSYTVEGTFTCDVTLPDGRTVCLLQKVDFEQGNTFARLEPGDTVYLPANSTCFLCNTNRIDPDGTEDPNGPIPAELLIWSATTGFNGDLENSRTAKVDPSQEQLHATRAWAFNPGSRCN